MTIGYWTVGPTVNGKNVSVTVHSMVAECFLGPCPPGHEVNHIDGDKSNASASNLEYVTHSGNMAHARRAGLMKVGEDHGQAKLTNAQADTIRRRRMAGERGVDLAREFGIAQSTVCQISKGQRRAS